MTVYYIEHSQKEVCGFQNSRTASAYHLPGGGVFYWLYLLDTHYYNIGTYGNQLRLCYHGNRRRNHTSIFAGCSDRCRTRIVMDYTCDQLK